MFKFIKSGIINRRKVVGYGYDSGNVHLSTPAGIDT